MPAAHTPTDGGDRRVPRVVLLGGAGGVGSTLAFRLLTQGPAVEVVVVDTRPNMVTSHVMDLENVVALGGAPSTVRAGTAKEAVDADVVVCCAAVPFRLNTTRSVYLAENLAIVEGEVRRLADAGFGGALLMLTNPVDVLMTCLRRRGLLAREQAVGYTMNDSMRLRTAVADALGEGVHARDVAGVVLGEHGAGQVPILSRTTVRGEPVRLTGDQERAARAYMDTWYHRHVALDSGRTSTWASGLGAARMVEAIRAGSDEVIPACAALEGEYGIDGVCLGVPVTLGAAGVRRIEEWDLTPVELAALRAAGEHVRAESDAALAAAGH